LAPGEQTSFNMNMIAPADVPLDSSVAWNSFGFVGNKENGSALLASEPIKVGIASMLPIQVIRIMPMRLILELCLFNLIQA